MQLNKYKGVIRLVLERNAGRSASEITDELFKSLEIAQALVGEIDVMPNVSIETPARPMSINTGLSTDRGYTGFGDDYDPEIVKNFRELTREESNALLGIKERSGPVLVSAAPPVAVDGEYEVSEDDDVDYWESKPGKGDGCQRLQTKLQQLLPASIELQLPGFSQPLKLVLGIGSPGIKFVHVNYTIPGDSLGPRYTIMTSQKNIDPDVIVKDIMNQAAAFYSPEKRVIVPRTTPAPALPTSQELEAMLARDRKAQQQNDGLSGDEARDAVKDAEIWRSNRSVGWK